LRIDHRAPGDISQAPQGQIADQDLGSRDDLPSFLQSHATSPPAEATLELSPLIGLEKMAPLLEEESVPWSPILYLEKVHLLESLLSHYTRSDSYLHLKIEAPTGYHQQEVTRI
jgi:hypothetical protein